MTLQKNLEFFNPSNEIFFVITCSLIEQNFEQRQSEYFKAILQTINFCSLIPDSQVILVENVSDTGDTFLNIFKAPVLYTQNNQKIKTNNKGIKELADILHVIDFFNLKDDKLIVKQTGRYFIQSNSQFIKTLQNFKFEKYDAIVRYGSFVHSDLKIYDKIDDCITGLIGTTVSIIKTILFL